MYVKLMNLNNKPTLNNTLQGKSILNFRFYNSFELTYVFYQ